MQEFYNRQKYLKSIVKTHSGGFHKARRIFLEEPSYSTKDKRDREYNIKDSIAKMFSTDYRNIFFCGSAHLGFSPHKGKPFKLGSSDLDIAVISPEVFSLAFEELSSSTRAFTDETSFGEINPSDIHRIKERIWKRGFIHLNDLPSCRWVDDKNTELKCLSSKNKDMFRGISVGFYLSDYFYCWKQKSAIDNLIGLEC